MRRITKKLLLMLLGVMFTVFYCEFLIYYVVIAQCSWPVLKEQSDSSAAVLKAFILSDTHLLGPRKGHWLDKLRREWQMHRAFQTIVSYHKPDVIFVLGDLFDEGEWSDEIQYNKYVERFYTLFYIPDNIQMYVVAGNHDIGFHSYIRRSSLDRFSKLLNETSVQFLTLKENYFILINSMAMEGDSCKLCKEAIRKLENISEQLKCLQNSSHCTNNNKLLNMNYSRPILMQHFPLYRFSDSVCTEPDAPPLPEKNKPFRTKIDALSKDATKYIVSKISPRAVFGGHTHHGCLLHHRFEEPKKIEFIEFSVPSFSWRNRPDPKYMLVTFRPDEYDVNKCGLPRETTIAITAVVLVSLVTYYTLRKRSVGVSRF